LPAVTWFHILPSGPIPARSVNGASPDDLSVEPLLFLASRFCSLACHTHRSPAYLPVEPLLFLASHFCSHARPSHAHTRRSPASFPSRPCSSLPHVSAPPANASFDIELGSTPRQPSSNNSPKQKSAPMHQPIFVGKSSCISFSKDQETQNRRI